MNVDVTRQTMNTALVVPDERVHRQRRWRLSARRLSLVLIVGLLLAWEWAASTGRVSMLFFPAPSLTLQTLVSGLADGSLATHTGATLGRLVVGFLLGALPGLLLGLVMGWSASVFALADPIVAALHPLPKSAVLPLIILLFGINETSRFIVIALAVFFPMLINTIAGVREINVAYYEIAHTYNAGRLDLFRRLILPASLPFMLAGVRLGLNAGLTVCIVVEMVFASQGLGTVVWSAWQTMRTEYLYAALVLTALVGILLNQWLKLLSIWFIPWHRAPGHRE